VTAQQRALMLYGVLSVCIVCIVAKRRVIPKNCPEKQIGPMGKSNCHVTGDVT